MSSTEEKSYCMQPTITLNGEPTRVNLHSLMAFDAVTFAEKTRQVVMGDTSDETMVLAVSAQSLNGNLKGAIFQAQDDTTFGDTMFEEFCAILTRMDFKQFLEEKFRFRKDRASDAEREEETALWFYHKTDGLIVKLTSYSTVYEDGAKWISVNEAQMYFVVELPRGRVPFSATGGVLNWEESKNKPTFTRYGVFDVREGLRYRVNALKLVGTLHAVWPEGCFEHQFGVLNFSEDYTASDGMMNDPGYKYIARQRLEQCPPEVLSIFNTNQQE